MGENIYMLPSDINLNIRSGTAGYNNKILVSNEKFCLGKNDKVNASEAPAMKSHKVLAQATTTHNDLLTQKPTITHKEEKIAFNTFFNWNISDMAPASMN